MRKAVKPGAKIGKTITSKTVNEWNRSISPPTGTRSPVFSSEEVKILGILHSGAADFILPPYEPVLLTTSSFVMEETDTTLPPLMTVVKDISVWPTNLTGQQCWGITQEPISTSVPGMVMLAGITLLKLYDPPTTTLEQTYTTHIDMFKGEMQYGRFGRAELLHPIGSDTGYPLVSLSRKNPNGVRCKSKVSGVPAYGSALAWLKVPSLSSYTLTDYEVEVWNPHPTEPIPGNKEMVAIEIDHRLTVVFVECEP